ncbi:MAG TPA: glycoside hydrolase family 3 N-terminal domain-containing protein [Pyrinomonadaceae bacterium]|nr:glycoside hydrolase family 3 N-terminal domain-containing protein [Pyrinomonadaceae bacterium]
MDSKLIFSLPIEKKIGQLFFIGLPSTQIDEQTRKLIDDISPGGICLFARNIREANQTRNLLDEINEILPVKPFLSIDQEGGLVDRLRRIITPMPSASSLKTKEDVKKLAEITAEVLRIFGFNMNFAPVVDVIDNSRGTKQNGIFSRNFGTSKEEANEFGFTYLNELQKGGITGCLKHFPGLGASAVDSHEELPSVNISENELYEIDLFPYRENLEKKIAHCVMVAHAAFPSSDLQETDLNGKLLPSSLSFKFINKLLRGNLGFQGLVITDDLEMGAILKNYGIGEACKMAIKAGEDMLSICADPNRIYEGFDAVLKAVENGEISEERIDESLARIAKVKTLVSETIPFDSARLQILSDEIADLNKTLSYSYGG